MLRNKIGKPSQTGTNPEPSKTNQSRPTTVNLPNSTAIKVPSSVPSVGLGGIKTPSFIGLKPQVKPATTNLTATFAQTTVPTLTKKQNSQNQESAQIKTQQKSNPTRPQQIKTQQQRLAELVTKKAAQMKKEYQMINKISSQVGTERRSYVKEYDGKFGHALKTLAKRIQVKNKENQQTQVERPQKEIKQILTTATAGAVWKINEWDKKGSLKDYLGNFTADKYM